MENLLLECISFLFRDDLAINNLKRLQYISLLKQILPENLRVKVLI